jgi:hypothetical protein
MTKPTNASEAINRKDAHKAQREYLFAPLVPFCGNNFFHFAYNMFFSDHRKQSGTKRSGKGNDARIVQELRQSLFVVTVTEDD